MSAPALKKVRLAVVGLGFGASWVPAYRDHPDVEHVALCDTDEKKLSEVGQRCGIDRCFTSLESILSSGDYDAVHLLTPIPSHAAQSQAVLESGKHCACAIPMAVTLGEIEAVRTAARRVGKIYMLMETELFSPAFLYVKTLFAEGRFGNLVFLRGYHYQNMEGWPEYWMGFPPMHYGTHALGPLLALENRLVRRAICLGSGSLTPQMEERYGNPYPVETALLELHGTDVRCELTCCFFTMVRGFLRDRFNIYGDRMSFESPQMAGEQPVLFHAQPGELAEDQRGRTVEASRVPLPALADLVSPEIGDYVRSSKITRAIPLAHEFVRSILEERPPRLDIATAANWTAAGICAHTSALRGGAAVDVPIYD
jgi:predicted dehydrogenase